MRPFRSFSLLLIFLICFTGLSFLFPDTLNLPGPESLLPEEIIKKILRSDSVDVAFRHSDIPNHDTVPAGDSDSDFVVIPAERPSSGPLKAFLDSLQDPASQVRIMYFGDSQIEGDRLTSYLRSDLRKGRSGTGPGLFLPLMPVSYTRSVFVRASSNWKRYNYLSYKNREISHNGFGPLMSFCRYMPENARQINPVGAWVRIVPSKLADSTTSRYDFLKILYRNTQGDVKIEVRGNKILLATDTLKTGTEIREFVCPLYNSRDILIDFNGRTSPDIYGISIESKTGIIVDNIPQRGSAGLEFTMIDSNNLRESLKLLSPDLIILHYGLNIVKNIRDDYLYYEKGLFRQISRLKSVLPGVPVVVVGVTDMAFGSGETVRSYPNLPDIIVAQKKASEDAGAIFWDAREAMGGNASIIKWFRMEPPLAKKDMVHFTDIGTDTLARMMISDLFTVPEREVFTASAPEFISDSLVQPEVRDELIHDPAQPERSLFRTVIASVLTYNPEKPFVFSGPGFWVFFLVILGGYGLVYRRMNTRNLYLFLISLYFYFKTGGLFLILLLLVILIDYSCGILIFNSRTRSKRKFFLLVSILSNIGILAYFKYCGFLIHSFNDIFGTAFQVKDFLADFSNRLMGTRFDVGNIILPVGISFFTFQSLSYTIDVYRGKLEPVRSIIDFGFYVSFFPQLVAGPIVRASEFIPQLRTEFHLDKREFSHALFLVIKGLVKKIIISDFIAVNFVDRVFDIPTAYSGFENLLAIYGYGLQIYCDFSGYTDIAIGLALILGFRLPVNFNSPYKAHGIANFWKRWHISLSRWLKDYLYIPLGGNRKGKVRTNFNLMLTMLLGGLWHGADIRFIIWGGLHGLGLIVDKSLAAVFGSRTGSGRIVKAFSIFLTFQFVSFCWIFFRATDMSHAGIMLNQIFHNFMPSSFGNIFEVYGTVFSLIAVGYLIHFLPETLKESYRGIFIRIPVAVQMVMILAAGILLYHMRAYDVLPFIYFRF